MLTQRNGARLTEILVLFAAFVSAQGREGVVSRRPASGPVLPSMSARMICFASLVIFTRGVGAASI